MTNPRLDTFRAMVAKNPRNALARFGLANEALKDGLYEEAVEQLREYLRMHDDEGNAYGRLAEALERLGHRDEALAALRDAGIQAQIGTYALHRLAPYRDQGAFPGADAAFERALALPFHTRLTESDLDRVAEAVRGFAS